MGRFCLRTGNTTFPLIIHKLFRVYCRNFYHAGMSIKIDLLEKRVVIDVADSTISWLDKNGEKKSAVSGLYFNTSPVKIQSHDMRYFYLSVKSGMANGKKFSDVEKEWLASKVNPYLGLRSDEVNGVSTANEQWAGFAEGDEE